MWANNFSLWPPLALEAHTALLVQVLCNDKVSKLSTWCKILCRRILQKPKSCDVLILDHQSESQYLFNLNLVLITRLPVTTYLQMWKWLLKLHYTYNCIIICHKWVILKQERSWKYILHWKYSQESHLFAKQEAMSITQRASMLYPVQSAKSCCFLIRQNGKGRVNSGKHKIHIEI